MRLLIHMRSVILQDVAELVRFYPEDHLMWHIPLMRFILDSDEFAEFGSQVNDCVKAAVGDEPQSKSTVRGRADTAHPVSQRNLQFRLGCTD